MKLTGIEVLIFYPVRLIPCLFFKISSVKNNRIYLQQNMLTPAEFLFVLEYICKSCGCINMKTMEYNKHCKKVKSNYGKCSFLQLCVFTMNNSLSILLFCV